MKIQLEGGHYCFHPDEGFAIFNSSGNVVALIRGTCYMKEKDGTKRLIYITGDNHVHYGVKK